MLVQKWAAGVFVHFFQSWRALTSSGKIFDLVEIRYSTVPHVPALSPFNIHHHLPHGYLVLATHAKNKIIIKDEQRRCRNPYSDLRLPPVRDSVCNGVGGSKRPCCVRYCTHDGGAIGSQATSNNALHADIYMPTGPCGCQAVPCHVGVPEQCAPK